MGLQGVQIASEAGSAPLCLQSPHAVPDVVPP